MAVSGPSERPADLTGSRSVRVAGAAAAVVAGALVTWLTRSSDAIGPFAGIPIVVGLGLVVSAVLGSMLARRAVAARPLPAVLTGLALGVLVPALVAAVVALPFAPIAVFVSPKLWPLTVPAGLVWLLLLRWPPSRDRLQTPVVAALAIMLSGALIVVRFTEPIWTAGAAGGSCVTFPGERIEALEWSPNGDWLWIGSERDYTEGIVRVMNMATGEVTEVARGTSVRVTSGLAIDPAGTVTFLDFVFADPEVYPFGISSLWEAAPGLAARKIATLPTLGIVDLTTTPDGIGGLLTIDDGSGDMTRQAVWIRTEFDPAALEPMPDEKAAEPAMATLLQLHQESIRLNVGGVPTAIPWPADATGSVAVSQDGTELIYQAFRLTDDGEQVQYHHLVAQSIATGERRVLVEEATWEARVAGRRLAYVVAPAFSDNRLCLVEMPAT